MPKEFISSSRQGKKYEKIAGNISNALTFMKAVGINSKNTSYDTRSQKNLQNSNIMRIFMDNNYVYKN